MIKHHLKHMAIAAAAILVLLLALGVDLAGALRYAVLLACPLGMAAMVFMMGRGSHQHGPAPHPDADPGSEPSGVPQVDADRVSDDHERAF